MRAENSIGPGCLPPRHSFSGLAVLAACDSEALDQDPPGALSLTAASKVSLNGERYHCRNTLAI